MIITFLRLSIYNVAVLSIRIRIAGYQIPDPIFNDDAGHAQVTEGASKKAGGFTAVRDPGWLINSTQLPA
jgi:hypothetical protein